MTLHGALCGFLVKHADTRLSMSLRSCGTSAVTDVVGIGTHAHCSMNDIPCHALSTHALQMGVVQERASDSHTLKIMYCYRQYEIFNRLTYITTSLKRSEQRYLHMW